MTGRIALVHLRRAVALLRARRRADSLAAGPPSPVLAAAGLYIGFFVAPTDATQGESYRIIFIHVPAAWMSMLLYLVMAVWAAIGWAFNARLASMMARAIAPTGALFTFIALWTGAIWGKPTWGTWWVWDARLTSELILLFLYLGFIALVVGDRRPAARRQGRRAAGDRRRRQRADHLFLGAMVEHAAPGRDDQRRRAAPTMAQHDADRDAAHDARRFWVYAFAVVLHAGAGDHPRARARMPTGCASVGCGGWPCGDMNWDSAAEFFAMGGYGLYVWGSYAVTLARDGGRAARSARAAPRRSARRAAAPTKETRHEAASQAPGRSSRGVVAAVGVAAALVLNAFQSNLVFFFIAVAGRGRRGAARRAPSASAAWSSEGSVKRDGDSTVELRRHRHRAADPGALRRHPARPVPRGQGRGRAGPARAPTACSSPREVLAKHDENYMPPEAAEAHQARQQRQPQAAATTVGRAARARHDPRARPVRARARAAARGRAGHAAAGRRRTRNRAAGWRSRARPRSAVRARRARVRAASPSPSSRNDFSVALRRAATRNSLLPTVYRFAAVWGAHEGSLLLWALMLACWTVAVAPLQRATCRRRWSRACSA